MEQTERGEDRGIFRRGVTEDEKLIQRRIRVPIHKGIAFFAGVCFRANDGLPFFDFLGEKQGLAIIEPDGEDVD